MNCIIYSESPGFKALPADKAKALDPELPVFEVDDEALLSIKDGISFLFFSRSDYDHAVRKLSQVQIRDVFVQRRGIWSPRAAAHSIKWLMVELRKCLCLTALALKDCRQPDIVDLLRRNFEHTVKRLSNLEGLPPLGMLTEAEIFVIALERESCLCMEYDELPVQNGPELLEQRLRHAEIIARIIAGFGNDSFLDSLIFAPRRRGVNARPLSSQIRSELEMEGDLLVDWRGGTVIPWPHHDMDRLEGPGPEKEPVAINVLYLNAREFEEFAAISTEAQIERDFSERITSGIGDKIADHFNRLLINQLVYLWGLRDLFAASADTRPVPELDQLVSEDVPTLQESLQTCSGWPGIYAEEKQNFMGQLVGLEKLVRQRAEFFAKLDHDENWVEKRPDLEGFLAMGSMHKELEDAHRRTRDNK